MEATSVALREGFPRGTPDPTHYDDDRTAIWWRLWRTTDADPAGGRRSERGAVGAEVMTGVPPLHVEGLDTLYTFIPNAWAWERARPNPDYDPDDPACATNPELPQCAEWLSDVEAVCSQPSGSPLDGEPVVVRYDPPGRSGRGVWIGTPLYYFPEGPSDTEGLEELRSLMRHLTDWVMAQDR
jgi:hypothetical protein